MDPSEVVRSGYERIAARYDGWSRSIDRSSREHFLGVVGARLPARSRVLDLGCGTGLATAALAQSFRVVGVDFSGACLALARRACPTASFVQADITRLGLGAGAFDCVTCFYSLIHVPRARHRDLLGSISQWLRPAGLLVATMGAGDLPTGTDDDWLGVPMYWSSYDAATNVGLVLDAGLHVVESREVLQEEDGQPFTFLWVVAHKPVEDDPGR